MLEKTSQESVFFTPELIAREQTKRMESPRGNLVVAACCSGTPLARQVIKRYRELLAEAGSRAEVAFMENIDKRFSDSETCVRLEAHVSGYDVFLFQALFDPTSDRSVDQNYMALLIAARAFREHGASHVTAVVPYLAYARQDKPTAFMREPTTAKLMADLSIDAGIDRLVTWDPHSGQIRGFYGGIPVNMLESLTLFIDEFRRFQDRDDVIAVAPDAGASKFVTLFGRALDLKCAIASKFRPRPEEAIITEIIGEFAGKKVAIILDDMISSGGTVDALIRRLATETGINEIYLGVSHNLCVGKACDRLATLHSDFNLRQVVTTNTIPQTEAFRGAPFLTVRCLSDTLSRTINRIHYNYSVSEVFYRP